MRDDTQAAIARIDAYRARKVGQMLVTEAAPELEDEPEDVLLDLSRLDGKQLIAEYETEMATYATTPFDPDGRALRLYPHGVTIWSGFPGVGKTTLLRQLVCHLLQRDQRVFYASFEEHPKHLLVRMAATAAGQEMPSAHQMQWFIDAYADRLRLWGRIGLARHRSVLGLMRKLAAEGVTHAFVDSLMKLDIDSQDFEAQRRFANWLAAIAQSTGVHIHLVAHPKKPAQADSEPDINDVAGAKELGGIADNVIFVRRRDDGTDPLSPVTGMKIVVRKQRHGTGAWPTVSGWFHRGWRQFHAEQFPQSPIRYLPEDAYR